MCFQEVVCQKKVNSPTVSLLKTFHLAVSMLCVEVRRVVSGIIHEGVWLV